MQALGPNMDNLYKQNPKEGFSDDTSLKIGIQLIERLKILHSIGWVHNDIKLENIVVGGEDNSEIYLIDYGLASRFQYDDDKDNDILLDDNFHVEKVQLNKFSGTFLFASLNSCRGYSKSRRDDMESVFYLIAYLLNQRELPWMSIKRNNAKIKFS